jgi:ribosomal protein L7Ae-like RNA K-turn-binding protein
VGRGDASPADLHVRVVLGPADLASGDKRAEVAVDFAGGSFGRGAHVHVRPSCIERACRGGFARAFKRPLAATPHSLAGQIVYAAEQRMRGLLLGARRAKLLAFGEEARDAVAKGKAALAIVAVDAGASGTKGALLGAVHEGRVVAYGTKAELGALFGREEVAVVAILHPGVAAEVHCARAAADAMSVLARAGSES